MKKRVFALALAAALTAGSAVPVLAYTKDPKYSPDPTVTITPTPRSTITPRITTPPRSPKTGQVDYVLFGTLGAAACASIVVISKRKKDEEEA